VGLSTLGHKEQEGQKQNIRAEKDKKEIVTCERWVGLCRRE